jgi:hypothetical protein
MNLTLYNLTAEIQTILDDDEADFEKLGEFVPKFEDKASSIALFCEMTEDLAKAIKEREALVVAHRKMLERRVQRARDYLRDCMQAAEVYKVTDKRTGTSIALQKNPPAVKITDETLLPDDVWRVVPQPPPEVDKKLIAERLKGGETIPGAELSESFRVVIK